MHPLRTSTPDSLHELRGPAFRPEDAGYDSERDGFQQASRHRPALIVGAAETTDVRAAVEYAAAHELPVAVQATGHGLSVPADGGVLVSTARMNGVRVHPDRRSATVDAGVRWQQVVDEAARHGLAPLSGSSPHVGAVSYTLGGGLGLLARRYGYAADHVRAFDVVTADGKLRHVTPESDPDLFWAVRGAGGNFGVVTALEIGLVPITRVHGGRLVFDAEHAADVLGGWREWTDSVPDEVTSSAAMLPLPDLPGVPEPLRGRRIVQLQFTYAGDSAAGERLVAPLREIGPRLAEDIRDLPFTESGTIHDEPAEPHGYRADNAMLSRLDDSALRSLIDLHAEATVMCVLGLRHLGGALARPPVIPNAVGHRDARYLCSLLSPVDAPDPSSVLTPHRPFFDVLAPATLGRNLNFVYGRADAEQVRSGYDPGTYERLARLKGTHDPANMFRFNHNIGPEAQSGS